MRPDTCDLSPAFLVGVQVDTVVLLARGGFEPQHSEERLHQKYPWPFATDPVKVEGRTEICPAMLWLRLFQERRGLSN